MQSIKFWKVLRSRILRCKYPIINIDNNVISFDEDGGRYRVYVSYCVCNTPEWSQLGYAYFLVLMKVRGWNDCKPEMGIKLNKLEYMYIRASFKRLIRNLKKFQRDMMVNDALKIQEEKMYKFTKKFQNAPVAQSEEVTVSNTA